MPYIRNGTVSQKPLHVKVLELIVGFFETLKLLYPCSVFSFQPTSSGLQRPDSPLPGIDREIAVLCTDVCRSSAKSAELVVLESNF